MSLRPPFDIWVSLLICWLTGYFHQNVKAFRVLFLICRYQSNKGHLICFLKIPFPRWAGIKEFHPSGARNQLEAKREPTIKAGTSCSSKIERQLFRPILRENRAALFAHNFPPSAPLVFSYSSLPTRFFLLLPTCHYHHNISFIITATHHSNMFASLKKFEGKKR